MVEVSLTVGKLDASLALLLTKDHHLIEFPTILLPNGVKAGSIIKLKCDQDYESEKEEDLKFDKIQKEIFETFTTNSPKSPILKIKNITQTSCVLEWDKLNLGTSNLKNLILFKDGKKLGSIPQPLSNHTSKLSGLPIDKEFKFQLRLDTTAGTFWSNEIQLKTHKMTDLSGITVCLGDFSPNDPFTKEDLEKTLVNMGAKSPAQIEVKVDTTHFLCTRENKNNSEFNKANDMNIPIIRPEWLKACERERRIVGVRDFYLKDCVLPDLFAKNYWADSGKNKSGAQPISKEESVPASSAGETTTDTEQTNSAPTVNIEDTSNPKTEDPITNDDLTNVSKDSGINPNQDIDISEKLENEVEPEEISTEQNEQNLSAEPEALANEKDEDLTNIREEVRNSVVQTSEPNSAAIVDEIVEGTKEEKSEPEEDKDDKSEEKNNTEDVKKEELKDEIDDAFDSVPLEDKKPKDDVRAKIEAEVDKAEADLDAKQDKAEIETGNNDEEGKKEENDEEENGEEDDETEASSSKENSPAPQGSSTKKKKSKKKSNKKK
ncbi:CHS5 [Candida pseudojiufengensis]|uniref:CHS5 n=1 Tax=Candida pseudojiufengensis TaxID=497109 RepID=UPI002224B0EE|nr:CHS5 [Candida pseudojiufengensis]KAI5960547.1 CHS5 [Candida pseudojiufengensis]